MALVFNGIIIPEDVANVLSFNGSNIETVIYNGVEVWKQVLFSSTWSGVSTSWATLRTSGSNARFEQGTTVGAWVTASSTGVGTGDSAFISAGYTFTLQFRNTTLQVVATGYGSLFTSPMVYFNISTKFSGGGASSSNMSYFDTSGGLLRLNHPQFAPGNWISLT